MLAALMARAYFGSKNPFAFAHRGGALRWPENTLLAFQSSAELGYQHIETDLHETADGHFVLFHDVTLERTTDGRGPIRDRTLAELKSLDAAYGFERDRTYPYRGQEVRVPTLEEALELSPTLRFNLEIKPKDPGFAFRLWEFIAHHGIEDRVLVASEHDDVVAAFRRRSQGRVATSPGFREALRFWGHVLAGTERFSTFAFDALQIPPTFRRLPVVTERFVNAAHRHGIQVHVWTINDPSEMQRLYDLGVDAVMTDLPELLLEVLGQR